MWSTESELRLYIDDFLEANWYEYPTPERCGVSRKTLKRFEEGNIHNMKYATVYRILHNVGWTDDQIPLLSPEKLMDRLKQTTPEEKNILYKMFGRKIRDWGSQNFEGICMTTCVGCLLNDVIKMMDAKKKME